MIYTLLHIVLLLAMPPLLLGVIGRTKAVLSGRTGAPLLQPYFDLSRLLRKDMVLSTTTSWIFLASPVVGLLSMLGAGLLIPLWGPEGVVGFRGDPLLFAYLFGLLRFFTTAAALDTGSPFEGMGAARDATFACLSEPALFCVFLVLARLSGSLSLGPMLAAQGWHVAAAPMVLIVAALFIVLLAESCRIPVDDPNTHLELTMIHEVMVLDHRPLLAMILYGAALKLFVLGSLLVHLLPRFQTGSAGLDGLVFVLALLALACVIGVVKSAMARLQLRHVPHLLLAACFFAGFAFILLVR